MVSQIHFRVICIISLLLSSCCFPRDSDVKVLERLALQRKGASTMNQLNPLQTTTR